MGCSSLEKLLLMHEEGALGRSVEVALASD